LTAGDFQYANRPTPTLDDSEKAAVWRPGQADRNNCFSLVFGIEGKVGDLLAAPDVKHPRRAGIPRLSASLRFRSGD